MSYAECLKKYYNAVDGTFYDAIKLGNRNSKHGTQNMYYLYFISYMVAGLAVSLVVFIWALNNGQFKDQQRARYLPLKDETDEDEPPMVRAKKISRYETYALMFLAFAGLTVIAAVLIFALLKGGQP